MRNVRSSRISLRELVIVWDVKNAIASQVQLCWI